MLLPLTQAIPLPMVLSRTATGFWPSGTSKYVCRKQIRSPMSSEKFPWSICPTNITHKFKVTGGITLYHVSGGPAPIAGLHFTFCEPSSVCSSSFSPLTPTCKMETRYSLHHKDLRNTGTIDLTKIHGELSRLCNISVMHFFWLECGSIQNQSSSAAKHFRLFLTTINTAALREKSRKLPRLKTNGLNSHFFVQLSWTIVFPFFNNIWLFIFFLGYIIVCARSHVWINKVQSDRRSSYVPHAPSCCW